VAEGNHAKLIAATIDMNGGIDLSRLQETLQHPLIDSDTCETLIYLPKWHQVFCDERNITEKDMIRAGKISGGFISRYSDI